MIELSQNPIVNRERLFQSGTTLKDWVESTDYKGDNLKKLAQNILKEWQRKSNIATLEELRKPIPEFDRENSIPKLPSTSVPIGSDVIHIHGLQHGLFTKVAEPLAKVVRDYSQATHNNGEQWFFEQGVKKDFGENLIGETLTDIHEYEEEVDSSFETGNKTFPGRLKIAVNLALDMLSTLIHTKKL